MRALKFGLVATLGGLFAIVVAVVIAYQSLPSYESLKSSPNGQNRGQPSSTTTSYHIRSYHIRHCLLSSAYEQDQEDMPDGRTIEMPERGRTRKLQKFLRDRFEKGPGVFSGRRWSSA